MAYDVGAPVQYPAEAPISAFTPVAA
jgi:hypothetical protein